MDSELFVKPCKFHCLIMSCHAMNHVMYLIGLLQIHMGPIYHVHSLSLNWLHKQSTNCPFKLTQIINIAFLQDRLTVPVSP